MGLESFSLALQRVAVARMVRQLSEVYSVVRVSTMSELAPFIAFGQVRLPPRQLSPAFPARSLNVPSLAPYYVRLRLTCVPRCSACCPVPLLQAEQMIVDAVRNGYFQARFDHKNNTVHFGGQVRTHSCLPACLSCAQESCHCCLLPGKQLPVPPCPLSPAA